VELRQTALQEDKQNCVIRISRLILLSKDFLDDKIENDEMDRAITLRASKRNAYEI
jgi:hypothetical protein